MKSIKKFLNKLKSKEKKTGNSLYFYDEEKGEIEFSHESIYNYLKSEVGEDLDLFALDYFGTEITYGEMFRKINLLARALRFSGVKKGDVVSICMPNTPEAVYVFYATNKIGAISEMIHPLSSPKEIETFLKMSHSKTVFMYDQIYEKMEDTLKNISIKTVLVDISISLKPFKKLYYRTFKKKSIDEKTHDGEVSSFEEYINKGYFYHKKEKIKFKSEEVAVILHSGGTTGTSKGVMLTNYNFNALARQGAVNVINVSPGDRIMTILPIFHGFGLGVCVHCPLCLKVEVSLIPEFDSKYFAKTIKRVKPNVIAGVPTLWEAMMKSRHFKKVSFKDLKYVISGGDSLPQNMEIKFNKFLEKHGTKVKVSKGYGMTECTAAVAYTFPEVNVSGSIGKAMVGNRIKICKPGTTLEVKHSEEGEICVCGPSVMAGYLDCPLETEKVLKKHDDGNIWLHTGDLGYIDQNGVLFFTQRIKRIIVSSGFNIYPSEIEKLIESHPKVSKCCVIGIPHPYKMCVPKAFVVLEKGYCLPSKVKAEIRLLSQKNLALYSQVKDIEFRDSLPKTLYNKIDYKKLEEEENENRKK